MILFSSLSPALGLGGPVMSQASGPPPIRNLLFWSESLDNAVWVASGGLTVAANVALDPNAAMTAEQLDSPALNAALAQTSTTPATTGAAVLLDYNLTGAWSRQQVTGPFGGVDYTFSVYLMGGDVGSTARIQLDRSGGFLRCSIIDRTDAMLIRAWGAQLEQSAAATDYVRRDGD